MLTEEMISVLEKFYKSELNSGTDKKNVIRCSH